MTVKTVLRGYQGQIFIGTAGSTAATQLTNRIDIQYDTDLTMTDITVAGVGTTLPIEEEAPVSAKASITGSMIYDVLDANMETLRAAAAAGTRIALRTKAYSSGKGFDGDVYVSIKQPMALKDGQKFDMTFSVNQELRAASLWS